MPVSELEKKPERSIRAASTEKRRPSGASFNEGVNPEYGERVYLEEKALWGQTGRWIARREIRGQFT
jgi:hypothetical protein